MIEKIKIPYPIIVEGKYDKITLSSVIEGEIFITSGFGIFKNDELRALIQKLAEASPIIILTDSDGAGTLIRSKIASMVPKERRIDLYIPEIIGKERRKSEPSKAGTLGVEGMESTLLRKVFLPFATDKPIKQGSINKTLLYSLGLNGRENSAQLRSKLCQRLGFPAQMSANAFLSAVNILYSENEFIKLCDELFIK